MAALCACAAPKAKAPPAAASADPGAVKVASVRDDVIRVTGDIADRDALAPLHCTAAKRARTLGAFTLEWAGGVAKPKADGYAADMVYEIAAAHGDALDIDGESDADPADGGPVPVENWMIYCDEAGMPREGQA